MKLQRSPAQLAPAQPALVQPAPVQPATVRLAAAAGQQQFAAEGAIEQVWLLDSQDEASKEELVRALSNNSIQMPVAAVSSSLPEVDSAIDEEIDGILIDATSQQMRNALIELADSQKFEISAFPLPGHETYSADVQNQQADQQTQMVEVEMADAPQIASKTDSLLGESQKANVESFDAMAAKVIEDVKSAGEKDAEGSSSPYQWPSLKAPAKALAQQLRGRRFSNVRKEDAQAKAQVAAVDKALDDAPAGMMGADAADLYSPEADASSRMPTAGQLDLADASRGDRGRADRCRVMKRTKLTKPMNRVRSLKRSVRLNNRRGLILPR